MLLNLLTLPVNGETLIVRWSASSIVKTGQVWAIPGGEQLLDDGYSVVSRDVTLPGDIKPRRYQIDGGTTITPSSEPAPTAAVSNPVVYKTFTWEDFNSYLIGLLNADPNVGSAALQDILEKCQQKTGTTDADKNTRYFYTWFVGKTSFTRAEVIARLTPVSTTCVSNGQKAAVANTWPTL